MRDGPRFHGVSVPGIAAAGLANGHPATAAIVLTDPHHDHLVLPGSGHAH